MTTLASGLTIPWDIIWVGDLMLFDERRGQMWSKRAGSAKVSVKVPLTDLYASGEGGLRAWSPTPARAATSGSTSATPSRFRGVAEGRTGGPLALTSDNHGRR